jgi:ABC-type methionine transport system ATPase subunit
MGESGRDRDRPAGAVVAHAQLHLTFPEHLVREPMVYRLGRDFGLQTNIRRANVDDHTAWFIIDLDGEENDLERAVAWLEGEGVKVDRIPIDG